MTYSNDVESNVLVYLVRQSLNKHVPINSANEFLKRAGLNAELETPHTTALSMVRASLKKEHGSRIEIRKFKDEGDYRRYGVHFWTEDNVSQIQETVQQNVIALNKKSGELKCSAFSLKEDIESKYKEALHMVSADTMKAAVKKSMELVGATPWCGNGTRGGVYIMPKQACNFLKTLKEEYPSIDGQLSVLSILDTKDSREDVASDIVSAYEEQISEWVEELEAIENGTNENFKAKSLSDRKKDYDLMIEQGELYSEILGEKFNNLKELIEVLRDRAEDLVDAKIEEREIRAYQKKMELKKQLEAIDAAAHEECASNECED